MYDICIADDEVLIQQSIAARIRESGTPLRVIGCAANAEKALTLYWSARPDIFFVDINMPRMDGLSLIRKIKEEDPDCNTKFIIITGYDDFAHLREAIQSGVMDYLKKPIAKEEFNAVLEATVTKIRHERSKSAVPRNGFICYEDWIAEKNQLFVNGVVLAIYTSFEEFFNKEESVNAIKEILLKLTGTVEKWLFFRFQSTSNIVLLHFPNKAIPRDDLIPALRSLPEQLCLSVVYAYPEMEQSEALVERLERSLNARFIHSGLSGGLFIKALPRSGHFSADLGMLDYALEHGHVEDAANAVETLIAKTAENIQSIRELCSLYRQIVLLLINKYVDHIISIPPSLKLELSRFALCKFPSLQTLRTFLTGIVSSLVGAIVLECPRGDLIQEVIEFLGQHYRNDISLHNLSKEFFVTPPYLSRRFKEKTGLTFVEYLEELRLKRAEEYLLASDMKIIDISEQVGYQDPNYFAKVFKRKYGLSPSDYRMTNKQRLL